MEIQYETEKKDLELSEKTLTIERNKALLSKRYYFIIALSGALISAFVFLFLYRQSQRQKRIIAKKNAVVQQEKLKQGSLKITVANWLTPNKHLITNKGLEPDIEIEITEQDFEKDIDPQLDRAIEIIEEMR